jgi:hypothetical protein
MKRLTSFGMGIILLALVFVLNGAYGQEQKTTPAPAAKKTATAAYQPQKAKSSAKELTVEQVIQLVQAGLAEDLVIAEVKKNGKAFDLNANQLLQLKKAGVSDNIIRIMKDPQTQLTPSSPVMDTPKPVAESSTIMAPRVTEVPAKRKEPDSVASNVPGQAGLYCLSGSELIKVDLKTLASAKVAGRVGHVLTLGIKSVKTNAYLIGPSAKTRVKDNTSPIFYIRLPEGFSIDEVVLVSLYVKADRRELEVSAQSGIVGSKQGLRMETMRPFENQELAPRLYKIATNILGRGEYLFYLVGSADTIKGIQGKGYDFGIE